LIARADDGTIPLHRAAHVGNDEAAVFLIDYHKKNNKKIFFPWVIGIKKQVL
jgi:ankyrin repeat protein